MPQITLTKGKTALVSDAQFDLANQFKWTAIFTRGKFYAARHVNGKSIKLHRYLMGVTDPEIIVDHINGDSLDCRIENLRLCTQAMNTRNQCIRKDNVSGFKGVHWIPLNKKFRARINANGKRISLGLFINAVDAARAYDKAAKELHGEFANLNFGE